MPPTPPRCLLRPLPQEAHKGQIEALMAAAQAQASKLGDDRLTIEHMVLALADNPRWVIAALPPANIS